MANRFRKAPQADLDLDSIWDFIASDSIRAAEKQIERIGEIFEMLAENPLARRERRELRAGDLLYPATKWRGDHSRHAQSAGY
ncbi:type II toxin-antitoxin system RelE/ParE family toxin [Bradyrhizobium sp. USDA 4486]